MSIKKDKAGNVYFTGSDTVRFQVTTLNMGLENGAYQQAPYFKVMFSLYRKGKLQFDEVYTMFAKAAKYKKSSIKVMTGEESELMEIMIDNQWISATGDKLVELDELMKEIGGIVQ
tara:strand:- start:4150 stop:4497 length:348 start_codon:yes stop_codon:yes gene_type:complete